jgi:N-acetylneuraminic acid mutarotase
MNSLKSAFTTFHALAVLKRLLVAVFAALLLGVLPALPALAAGSGTWTTTGSMSTTREAHTMTLLQNRQVLVAGGFDIYQDILASAELYNPATGTWTLTGSLNVARYDATATLLPNGQVLVAGGEAFDAYGVNIIALASAELYNPATGTWTLTGSLNVARYDHSATLLQNGQVLVAGGYGLASAELYNPATGQWTLTGSMNMARDGAPATLLSNGQVLVAGGASANGLSKTSAELYNPATGQWTLTGSMNAVRARFTMTQLTNGQVLAAGGVDYESNGSVQILASAELYNPATGQWTLTGSLNAARVDHAATRLSNGQVLAAGGNGTGFNTIASAELYNPAAGTWTTTGSLNVAREAYPMTLLSNGQVLVAGGSPSYHVPSALASAELYTP